MKKNKEMSYDEFTIPRYQASRLLRTSMDNMDTLGLPFVQIGDTGRKRYRLSDIEKAKQDSIHQGK